MKRKKTDIISQEAARDQDAETPASGTDDTRTGFLLPLAAFLVIPVTIIYMELLAKAQIFDTVFDDWFLCFLLPCASLAFLTGAIPMLLPGKHCRRAIRIILAVLAVLFSAHEVYFNIFHTFFSWNNIGEAGGAAHFWREALISVGKVWYLIAANLLPFILMCVFGKRIAPDKSRARIPFAAAGAVLFLGLYLPALLMINSFRETKDQNNPYYHYNYIQSNIDQTFRFYGILTTTRLDLKQLMFGAPVETIDINGLQDFSDLISVSESDIAYGWNKMDIDFDSLEKDETYSLMDAYYKSVSPTRKNKYSGIFEGKNLIFLTLESFSTPVIDPEFTPLLYQMSTEGFVFRNFYNPTWGGSTASGEYAIMTGNFSPYTKCLNLSADTYQPFAFGAQFAKKGYKTLAYHNYIGRFYDRDASHPNFGYDFKGVGSGLKLKTNTWPNSDKEMADATVDEFAGLKTPFHVYYMTMSGHMQYDFAINRMSKRHEKDLPEKYNRVSKELRAYYACQYEVELMLQVLVDELKKNGNLENTVFAMSADHYPYAMTNYGLSQLYQLPGPKIRNKINLYRNSFILWTPTMTSPVVVDTPCTPVDILPTLSNMFGLEYDSRLMMGTDIMSDGEHVAPIKLLGWSWVSTQGEYLSETDTFTPNASCTLSPEMQQKYVENMNEYVKAKTSFSKLILETDYYRHVFRK